MVPDLELLRRAKEVYDNEPDFIIPYDKLDDYQLEKMDEYFQEHIEFYDLDALSLKWYRRYDVTKIIE